MSKTLPVTLPNQMAERLNQASDRTGLKKAEIVRSGLMKELKDMKG